MKASKSQQVGSKPVRVVNGTDLRDRYPDVDPPNGWLVSRPRHPQGWIAQLVDDIHSNGGSAQDIDHGRAGVIVIDVFYGDWDPFPMPWRIEMNESRLTEHLSSFLKPDGTVHGMDDPDDPVETDPMMAAYNLFTIHLEEAAKSVMGMHGRDYALVPGAGLLRRYTPAG